MSGRLPDWEKRLIALVNERRLTPYAYGINDCSVFAMLAVEAVTGTVLLRGVERPRGMIAAARFLIARGWEDVEQAATELLGQPSEAAGSRRGDIVSYEAIGEKHLAVRVGDSALTPSEVGLIPVLASRWRLGWKVG